MIGSASLSFPGSRTLASWWPHLADQRPQAWWVGHLLLHRLEVPIRKSTTRPLDLFDQMVLQTIQAFPALSLEQLDRCLRLGPQILFQFLRGLERVGLLESTSQGWALTELGQQALAQRTLTLDVPERQVFHFVVSTLPERAPHFLHLQQATTQPCLPPADWHFDPHLLWACFEQSEAWKERHSFPRDLRALDPSARAYRQAEPWQRVVLDRAEQLAIVLLLLGNAEGGRLIGYPIRQDNWTLLTQQPVLTLDAVWPDVFPELAVEPSMNSWRQAWQNWCQARGLGGLQEEISDLHLDQYLLRVTVSQRLLDRLRSTRSEALRNEAWVLIGDGRLRRVALLQVMNQPAAPS